MLATLTVTQASENPTDVPVFNGSLTLREAIDYVNGVDPGAIGTGDRIATLIDESTDPLGVNDLIKFDPSVFGVATAEFPMRVDTIELLHGQLDVNNPVTIDGAAGTILPGDTFETPGPGWENLTISAAMQGDSLVDGDGERIFNLRVTATQGDPNPQTTLRELSLTGGDSLGDGGAINARVIRPTMNGIPLSHWGAMT